MGQNKLVLKPIRFSFQFAYYQRFNQNLIGLVA